jgi:hypothetical protein
MLQQYRLFEGTKKRAQELMINFADRRTVPMLKNFISGLQNHYARFHLYSTRLVDNDNKFQPVLVDRSNKEGGPALKLKGSSKQSNYVFVIVRFATPTILNALQKESPDANSKQQLKELFLREQTFLADPRRKALEKDGNRVVYVGDFPFIEPEPPLKVAQHVVLHPFFISGASATELESVKGAVSNAYHAPALPEEGSGSRMKAESSIVISVREPSDTNVGTKNFLHGDEDERLLYQSVGLVGGSGSNAPTFVINSSDYDDLLQGNAINIKSIRNADGSIARIQGEAESIEARRQAELRNLISVDGFDFVSDQQIQLEPEHYVVFIMPTKLFTSTVLDFETPKVSKGKRRALDKLVEEFANESLAEVAKLIKDLSKQLGNFLDGLDSIEQVIETKIEPPLSLTAMKNEGPSKEESKFSRATEVSAAKDFVKSLVSDSLKRLKRLDIEIEKVKRRVEELMQRYAGPNADLEGYQAFSGPVRILEQSFNEKVVERYIKIEEGIEELKSKYVWLSSAKALADEEEAARKNSSVDDIQLSILNNNLTDIISDLSENLVYNTFEAAVEYQANEADLVPADIYKFHVNILRMNWTSTRDALRESKLLLNYYRKILSLYSVDKVPENTTDLLRHAIGLQQLSKQRLFARFDKPDLRVAPFETWTTGFSHEELANVFQPSLEQVVMDTSQAFKEDLVGKTERLRKSLGELMADGTLAEKGVTELNEMIRKSKRLAKQFDKAISESGVSLVDHINVSHVIGDLTRDPALLSLIWSGSAEQQQNPDFASIMARVGPIHEANDELYQTIVQLGVDITLFGFEAERLKNKLEIRSETEEGGDIMEVEEPIAENVIASSAAAATAPSEGEFMDISSKFHTPAKEKSLSIRRPGKNQRRVPSSKR